MTEMQSDQDQDDAFPAKCVIWWTGAPSSIPNKWALADGTANHADNGGSGKNLIGYFIKATHTDGHVGSTTAAVTITGSATEHSHSAHTEHDTIPLYVHIHDARTTFAINEDTQHLASGHTHTITLGDGTAQLEDNGHSHDLTSTGWSGIMDTEVMVQNAYPSSDHIATISPVSTLSHSCSDVAGRIADHATHNHAIENILTSSTDGTEDSGGYLVKDFDTGAVNDPVTSALGGSPPLTQREDGDTSTGGNQTISHGADGSGAAWAHAEHRHDNKMGTMHDSLWVYHHHNDVTQTFPPGHTHTVSEENLSSLQESSVHGHSYLHTHEPHSYDQGDIPDHTLADQWHHHPVGTTQERHRHALESSPESSHVHTVGNPDSMSLIPIERLP